ncbi:hypothetical protein D3C72_2216120 [compost metagenome]
MIRTSGCLLSLLFRKVTIISSFRLWPPLLLFVSVTSDEVFSRTLGMSREPSFFSLKSLVIKSPGFRLLRSTMTAGSEVRLRVPLLNAAVL